jgi:hypothetical protein
MNGRRDLRALLPRKGGAQISKPRHAAAFSGSRGTGHAEHWFPSGSKWSTCVSNAVAASILSLQEPEMPNIGALLERMLDKIDKPGAERGRLKAALAHASIFRGLGAWRRYAAHVSALRPTGPIPLLTASEDVRRSAEDRRSLRSVRKGSEREHSCEHGPVRDGSYLRGIRVEVLQGPNLPRTDASEIHRR